MSCVSPNHTKLSFATRDFALQVTVIREAFVSIPNVRICHGQPIYMVIEDRRPCYWSYGAKEHMAKPYLDKQKKKNEW